MRRITFTATLPDIISAISLPGSDDIGARIKLDVSPHDLPAVVELKAYGVARQLRITVEVDDQPIAPPEPPPDEEDQEDYSSLLQ